MNNNVLLISEKTIKQDTLVNENVGAEYILPAIRLAQDAGLQNLIGSVLYQKLQALVADGTITDTTNENYKNLLDFYIAPYLEWRVMSDIQIPLAYKMRNSGITQTNNQYQNNSVMKDAQTLSDYYDQKASFYANRLTDYLIANSTNYPEYYDWRNISDMKANPSAYNTGIYLGKGHLNCWKASVINEAQKH